MRYFLILLAVISFACATGFPSGANAQTTLGTSASVTNPQRSGQASTGLFSSASGAISFSSSGTEMMRITSAGIGIGVTSPQAKLNIIAANSDSTTDLVFTYDSSGDFRNGIANMFNGTTVAKNHMDFLVSNGTNTGQVNVMTLNGLGYVGIGTTSPETNLQISVSTTGGVLVGGSGCGGNFAAISLNGSVDTTCGNFYNILSSSTNNDLFFNRPTGNYLRFRENNNDEMVIVAGGNIGIGTNAPDALLSLNGQSAQTIDLVRETTASTAGNSLAIQAGGATSGGTNLNGGTLNLTSGISTGTGSSGINFNIYKAGSSGTSDNYATTAVSVTGTGNVGIGTTAPDTGTALDLSANTNSLLLPVGTTGQEPVSPVNGMMRYNSSTPGVEAYYSGGWNTLGAGSATPGALILIATATASSSSSISFTSIPSGYDQYVVTLANVVPVTNGAQFYLQMGETGSCTLETSDYQWAAVFYNASGTSETGEATDSQIDLTSTVGGITNASNIGVSGTITLFSLESSSLYKQYAGTISYLENGGYDTTSPVGGRYTGDTNAITCLTFFMSTGNISSGKFALYGIKNS
jgi:hypothetical protein